LNFLKNTPKLRMEHQQPRKNPFRSDAFNLTKQLETETQLAKNFSNVSFTVEKVVIDAQTSYHEVSKAISGILQI